MNYAQDTSIATPGAFSLARSAGPVRWGGERSPRHAIVGRSVISVEVGNQGAAVVRQVRQDANGTVRIASTSADDDQAWFDRVFRPAPAPDTWDDPVIERAASAIAGLNSFTDGSLFTGILTSIIGQSISLASASAVQRRLALSFAEPIEVQGRELIPLPGTAQLAESSVELLRASGMTWKRAEAIRLIAREHIDGNLPTENDAASDRDGALRALLALPMVGRWTAESALLWGIGDPNAFPSGDVALLRAVRLAYNDSGISLHDLDAIADRWRPWRGTATRLLWTQLLGPAW